jgi:hypothetical protein
VVYVRSLTDGFIRRFGLPGSLTDNAAPRGCGGAVKAVSDTVRCLVIGLPDAVLSESLKAGGAALLLDMVQLSDRLPLPPAVELVVVPLFCAQFDALEVIEVLGAAGYRGLLRVVAPSLPNRQIVLRELRSHAVRQGITLEMLERP